MASMIRIINVVYVCLYIEAGNVRNLLAESLVTFQFPDRFFLSSLYICIGNICVYIFQFDVFILHVEKKI